MFEVEVVFATAEHQTLRRVTLAEGATAADAIAAAGLTDHCVDAAGAALPLACFGRLISPATRLRPGDRVEILRSLVADPKDQRRERVQAAQRARRRKA